MCGSDMETSAAFLNQSNACLCVDLDYLFFIYQFTEQADSNVFHFAVLALFKVLLPGI